MEKGEESAETDSYLHSQLTLNKFAKAVQLERKILFSE